MKHSLKDYVIDTLMLGLSISITSVLALINISASNGNLSGNFVVILIIFSFVCPFIFGIFFSKRLNKKSLFSYLTVFVITEIISILHITMPDTYFMFLFTNEMWVRSLFNNYNGIRDIIIACIVPILYIVLYFLGSKLKSKKQINK